MWLGGFTEDSRYFLTSLIGNAPRSRRECWGSLGEPLSQAQTIRQRDSSLAGQSRSSEGLVSNCQTCSLSLKRPALSSSWRPGCSMEENSRDSKAAPRSYLPLSQLLK